MRKVAIDETASSERRVNLHVGSQDVSVSGILRDDLRVPVDRKKESERETCRERTGKKKGVCSTREVQAQTWGRAVTSKETS